MTRIGLMLNQLGGRTARCGDDGGSKVKIRSRALVMILFLAVQAIVTQSAGAQTRGGAVTIHYAALSPVIALLAGILILIIPRLLNYIVAIYLILVGIIGVFGV